MKLIITSVLILIPILSWAKNISVATNQWSPYINAQNQPLGAAADLLRQVLAQEKHDIDWHY
ncbi:MAG: hypothetical protein JKX76_14630, partial [Colwellia sp.]|nr:hypothetical protein [Colwellia sp.]